MPERAFLPPLPFITPRPWTFEGRDRLPDLLGHFRVWVISEGAEMGEGRPICKAPQGDRGGHPDPRVWIP